MKRIKLFLIHLACSYLIKVMNDKENKSVFIYNFKDTPVSDGTKIIVEAGFSETQQSKKYEFKKSLL